MINDTYPDDEYKKCRERTRDLYSSFTMYHLSFRIAAAAAFFGITGIKDVTYTVIYGLAAMWYFGLRRNGITNKFAVI